MARPIKYRNDEERLEAARRTADVLHEIKANSGLTYVGLSAFLANHKIIVGDDMLRQYASANKPIGARRLTEIAQAACSEGWAGDKCFDVLMFHNYDYVKSIKSLSRDVLRNRQLLGDRLSLCAEELAVSGVSAFKIRQMVDDGLRRAEEKLSRV